MLSVWNTVGKRLQQKLKTDIDAPYPELALTSKDVSDEPPGFPACLSTLLESLRMAMIFRIINAISHPRSSCSPIQQKLR